MSDTTSPLPPGVRESEGCNKRSAAKIPLKRDQVIADGSVIGPNAPSSDLCDGQALAAYGAGYRAADVGIWKDVEDAYSISSFRYELRDWFRRGWNDRKYKAVKNVTP